jgi:hypothetical protein
MLKQTCSKTAIADACAAQDKPKIASNSTTAAVQLHHLLVLHSSNSAKVDSAIVERGPESVDTVWQCSCALLGQKKSETSSCALAADTKVNSEVTVAALADAMLTQGNLTYRMLICHVHLPTLLVAVELDHS